MREERRQAADDGGGGGQAVVEGIHTETIVFTHIKTYRHTHMRQMHDEKHYERLTATIYRIKQKPGVGVIGRRCAAGRRSGRDISI